MDYVANIRKVAAKIERNRAREVELIRERNQAAAAAREAGLQWNTIAEAAGMSEYGMLKALRAAGLVD